MVELIEGSQADLSVTNYLHHYWLSSHEYVTVKKLYKDLKRKVTKQNAKETLASLVRDARTYREIQETAYRKWQKNEYGIRDSLDTLGLFRLRQPLPMMLAIMHAYDAGDIKQKHVEDILGAIENFHFSFTAITSQRSSGGISFMYALHARTLLAAGDLDAKLAVLTELKDKLKTKAPSYAEFEPSFLNLRFSRSFTKQKKLVQYILAKIDRTMSANGVALDYSQMTIEHIAPQGGPSPLPDEDVGCIGNLLLVEKGFNSKKLAAKGFATKKAALMRSKVFLDPVIEKATDWTKEEIAERAKWLAQSAFKKVWKV